MPHLPVTVLAYNDSRRPHLKYQVRVRHPDGRIQRLFFRTKTEAEAERGAKRTEMDNIGIDALKIDPRTRLEVVSVLEKIKPFEVSLTQVADFFVDHHRANCLVKEACDLYLTNRKSKAWSALHKRNLKSIVLRFVAEFADRPIALLTVAEIENWLDGLDLAPASFNSYRGLLSSVFAFAKKRKLTKVNPFEDIDAMKVSRDKVGILTPDQIRSLLTASKDEPDVQATFALGVFAGLRPEEVARIGWANIDLEHGQIDCPAHTTKTARHRYVKILPSLAAWLSQIGVAREGLIQEINFRNRFRRARWFGGFITPGVHVLKPNNSGQESATPEERSAFEAKLVEWPHDCLRHSYASYHFAHFEDPMALAAQLGHETTKLIFSTYRDRVKKSDATAWWNLLPQ